MLFTTYGFLAFMAALIPAYYLCPKGHRWKLLLAASAVFYAFSGAANLIFIAATAVSSYAAARAMDSLHAAQSDFLKNGNCSREEKKLYRAANKSKRLRWLAACLTLNFGALAVLKYADFAFSGFNSLFRPSTEFAGFGFLLPFGISFYTFQTMGYVIDVYRGKYAAERSPFKLALFTSFFPQLIQGPISRFDDLKKTLYNQNAFDAKNLSYGLQRVLFGLFKKLVIADRLLIAIRTVTADPETYGGLYALMGVTLYAAALYADFTGGIDIAIGAAETLGIRISENFNSPFYSKSITEYWRRWHITLGAWFRDYMFYPISVCGPMLRLTRKARASIGDGFGRRVTVYIATMAVWFTTGLWHGARLNFILWGVINGAVIIASQECEPLYARFHGRFKLKDTPVYGAFEVVRTFCLMSFIRSLDIYADAGTTFRALGSIFTRFIPEGFTISGLTALGLSAADYAVAAAAIALLIVLGRARARGGIRDILARHAALRYAAVLAMALCVIIFGIYGAGYDAKQFIYGQF